MYESFYGLSSKPFQLNPDPSFYFGSTQHRRASAFLEYGLHQNEGFIVVTGEVGAGKTTIVRGLLNKLDQSKVVAAQLVSTQLDAEDTLRMVAAAFGVKTAEEVLTAARAGDALALTAIDHATGELGRVLALLADSLDPEIMVIGGGLGCAPGPYFDALAARVRDGLWDGVPNPMKITQATMGPDAGLIGAALATELHQKTVDEPQHSN